MFFNFEANFVEKFLWESGFSNFGHVTQVFSRSQNPFFGRHFETVQRFILFILFIYLFIYLFIAGIWLLLVYVYIV